MLSTMRNIQSLTALLAVFLTATFMANARTLSNREVLILFNKADPESARLAEAYQDARAIPADQILGLTMPLNATHPVPVDDPHFLDAGVYHLGIDWRFEIEDWRWHPSGAQSIGTALPDSGCLYCAGDSLCVRISNIREER